jgi:serine/threonine protein phosphatase 1
VIGDIHGRAELVDQLIRDVPWNLRSDKVVFLGDLIDRGRDARGVVERVISLQKSNPQTVVLRGNHEQMLIDCLDYGDFQWLIPGNGGLATLESYGIELRQVRDVSDIKLPRRHVQFIRSLPFYHEDKQAIYVHAGLSPGRPPGETDPEVLMWTRDPFFFEGYRGKLCFFGHTPTQFLPRRHRKQGIYINGGCVGIDTSGDESAPLSCVCVETFTLYQAYPDGETQVDRLRHLKPSSSP